MSGDVVDRWGAKRIVAACRSGEALSSVAAKYETSVSTVKRVYSFYHETGRLRSPQVGKGKKDDPRSIYAGPRGPENLLYLESAVGHGNAEDLVSEIHQRHLDQEQCEPSCSTVARVLRTQLDISGKRLTGAAQERDAVRCELWMQRMVSKYHVDQLLLIDETHCDDKVQNRRFGRSRRGTRAKGVVMFHKGPRFSALGIFSIQGMLDCHVTEGGYDADKFRQAFRKCVVPQLRPYPEPCSVLVLDNCPNLHTQLSIINMVHDADARIEFLEPYDPHHMPIEIAFRAAKGTLREDKSLKVLPRRERLRTAVMGVSAAAARNAFRECGYPVP